MRTIDPARQQQRRAQIVDAARQCFSRKGFHGTSTNDVCAMAGMSPGNLFHYFPNKKALIVEVVAQQGQQVQALLEELGTVANPRHAVEMLFDVLFAVASDADDRRLVLEIAAEAARDPDVQALCQRDDAHLRDWLQRVFGSGAQGATAPASAHATDFLMALIDGIFSRVAVDPACDLQQVRQTLHWLLDRLFDAAPAR